MWCQSQIWKTSSSFIEIDIFIEGVNILSPGYHMGLSGTDYFYWTLAQTSLTVYSNDICCNSGYCRVCSVLYCNYSLFISSITIFINVYNLHCICKYSFIWFFTGYWRQLLRSWIIWSSYRMKKLLIESMTAWSISMLCCYSHETIRQGTLILIMESPMRRMNWDQSRMAMSSLAEGRTLTSNNSNIRELISPYKCWVASRQADDWWPYWQGGRQWFWSRWKWWQRWQEWAWGPESPV